MNERGCVLVYQLLIKMATFQMPSYYLESRNKYIGSRIKRNIKNQEICYLYSQEGTRFQISKVCIPCNCMRNIIQFLKNISSNV